MPNAMIQLNADEQVMIAKTQLVLHQPFFGALVCRLNCVPDPSCETTWTDGVTFGYNPAHVEQLTLDQLQSDIAHQVLHCASGHPWRRGLRDAKKWDRAADFAINGELKESGFDLPPGALYSDHHAGKSAEFIYDCLIDDQQGNGGGGQKQGQQGGQKGSGAASGDPQAGKGDPGGDKTAAEGPPNPQGEVREAPPESAEEGNGEGDWREAVQQAAMAARARGKLPGSLNRFAKDRAEPTVDWRSVLRRFVQEAATSDYTWRRPNRRYVSQGIILPSLHSEEMGAMVVAIDTSGSIGQTLMDKFASELRGIVQDVKPSRVIVMYCDAKIQSIQTFERDDDLTLKPRGGGGTDFRPVFTAVEKMDEPVACVVYLTDMEGSFPSSTPEVPTLWASINKTAVGPFGETVFVDA